MKLPEGSKFGAAVGLGAGTLSGCACCWFMGETDYLGFWVLFFMPIGAVAGVAIGSRMRRRGSDIATPICVAFSLFPAFLILSNGLGLARGRFTGMLALGAAFAFPMFALLLGAILDRLHQKASKPSDKPTSGS
jgi:hypothetical protein